MPRRRVIAKREILPDPKYGNQTVAKFINERPNLGIEHAGFLSDNEDL